MSENIGRKKKRAGVRGEIKRKRGRSKDNKREK